MEGDYLAPKLPESELPKNEEEPPTPELFEEKNHEAPQAKPALAGVVATETLKNNPNPAVRKIAATEIDPDFIRQQVQEAAQHVTDAGAELLTEKGYEQRDDPLSTIQRGVNAESSNRYNIGGEPPIAIRPTLEESQAERSSIPHNPLARQSIVHNPQAVSLYKQAFVVGLTTAVAILAIFITIKLT